MHLDKYTELIKFIPSYSCMEDLALDKNARIIWDHNFCHFSIPFQYYLVFQGFLNGPASQLLSFLHNPKLSCRNLDTPVTAHTHLTSF